MGLPGVYATIRGARKDKVDNAATVQEMALDLIQPYKDEVDKLREELRMMRCELDNERAKRRELEKIVDLKDGRIAEMQAEIDGLRAEVEALQKGRRH